MPVRARFLLISILWHAVCVAVLTHIPAGSPRSSRPIYDEFIRPRESTVLYYRAPKAESKIAPERRIGRDPVPRAPIRSPRTAIADVPKAASRTEFIWQDAPREIPVDVPVPTLAARAESALLPSLPRPAPREFVPPPPSRQQPKLPLPVEISAADVPVNLAAPAPVPASNTISFSNLAAPPVEKLPVSPSPSTGNAKADIAIASIRPAESDLIPAGTRTGAFATAPTAGATSSGTDSDPKAVTAPNLAARDPEPAKNPAATTIVYSQRVSAGARSIFSAPLRPSNRSIPRALDQRFAGRSVYAIVIPIEKMPVYEGDWILWFAESNPAQGAAPLMRAPTPARKFEIPTTLSASSTRIQIAAKVDASGKLRNPEILPNPSAATPVASGDAQAWIIADLSSWEFQPATRNGVATAVDVVFEITFHLPAD